MSQIKMGWRIGFVVLFSHVVYASEHTFEAWLDGDSCSDVKEVYQFAKRIETQLNGKVKLKMRGNPSPIFEGKEGDLSSAFLFHVAQKCVESQKNTNPDTYFKSITKNCVNLSEGFDKIGECLSTQAEKAGMESKKLRVCLAPAISLSKKGKAPSDWSVLTPEIQSVLNDYHFLDQMKPPRHSCHFLMVDGNVYDFSVSTQDPHPTLNQEFDAVEKEIISTVK